jgi:DNA-binding NarL/FixJ family response regulator
LDHSPASGDIGVLLAHSSALYRTGCRQAISSLPDFVVMAEAARVDEAYAAFTDARPKVCVVELDLPPAGAVEFMRRALARDASAAFVIVGVRADGASVLRLLTQGATACVRHDCSPEELVDAVREACAGRRYLTHNLAQEAALMRVRPREDGIGVLLSSREYEILRMVSSGMKAGDIARALSLSVRSVGNYTSRVKKKLGATNTAELVHLAIRHRIIEPAT